MRTLIIVAATVVALGACAKSVDQRFKAMCADQKTSDPQAYAMSEKACLHADDLTDGMKSTMIDAYEELKRARAAIGDGK